MTPERAEIELLKHRVERIERRANERFRAAAALIVFGFFVFKMTDRIPGLSNWLADVPVDALSRMKLMLAILLPATIFALAEGLAERRERRNERALRDTLLFSPLSTLHP